ncbi:hypothetical protein FB45DRAFT_801455 [Roridomyces roridus]|uniref:Uncharacterized protein n=1 Tax=Roridomyces roridus TaxID=1738132 RepID=A0AAD7BAP1_9AGAR|nr:hypothetical protein FB45DRAFT_801455 [Roridomyces roridus]
MEALRAQLQAMGYVPNSPLSCREGDKLLTSGKRDAAKVKYLSVARDIVGRDIPLPSLAGLGNGGYVFPLYVNLPAWDRTNLMGCCLGMARCLLQEGKTEMALAWLEEINALQRCSYFMAENPLYDWIDFSVQLPEMLRIRVSALCLASETFISLGNSGTGTTRRHAAYTTVNPRSPELESIIDVNKLLDMYMTLHPNPQTTLPTDARSNGLQLRGSWTKLGVAKAGGPTEGREASACFIWNGRLYVSGGRKSSFGPWFRDIWYLDLATRDVWRQLPDYPYTLRQTGLFVGWTILVYKNQALLFTGRPAVDVFDLVKEKWTTLETTYSPTEADIAAGVKGGWPYPDNNLSDAAMQIVGDKMYVFGGSHGTTLVGCNLFMELDLTTRKWRRLTGTVHMTQHSDYTCPGPRKSAASWVSPDEKRFFLLFGHADRQAAKSRKEMHYADRSFAFADMWSWDIKREKWRQERMSGNSPCSRTELSFTYNPKLKKVIIFGGYQPSLPTVVLEKGMQFEFSYFADTFVYDMASYAAGDPDAANQLTSTAEPTLSAPKWLQVMTHGFPTYRCQAQLVCDPDTGRNYLFGGWTNHQYVPTRTKLMSRSFGDLWELKLDDESGGGYFEEVDVEDEARSARAGPWQRCFACASAGPWKKCGGSCNGKAFFCGSPCFRDGWKEHKEMHKCRKV